MPPLPLEDALKAALSKGDTNAWNTAVMAWKADWKQHHPNDPNPYIHLTDLSMANQRLQGFDFKQVIFDHCSFTHCSLDTVNFFHSQLIHDTRFSDCTFTSVNMRGCFMDNAHFSSMILPVSGMKEFDAHYQAVVAGVSVGTWVNNIGLTVGTELNKLVANSPEPQRGYVANFLSHQWNVTTQVQKLGQDFNATLQYKLNPSDAYLASLFVKADVFTNTAVAYDSHVGPNATVSHNLKNTGVTKPFIQVGVNVGF